MPKLTTVTGSDGAITDVQISYPMDLTKQMLATPPLEVSDSAPARALRRWADRQPLQRLSIGNGAIWSVGVKPKHPSVEEQLGFEAPHDGRSFPEPVLLTSDARYATGRPFARTAAAIISDWFGGTTLSSSP